VSTGLVESRDSHERVDITGRCIRASNLRWGKKPRRDERIEDESAAGPPIVPHRHGRARVHVSEAESQPVGQCAYGRITWITYSQAA